MKILFLLKKNNLYGYNSTPTSKSGLLNSARITAHELHEHLNIETEVRICEDANSIDREVTDYQPDICIVEAIWVLPGKFEELKKHHPKLPFIVRVHSEIPFLSTEGEAVNRIYGYLKLDNVSVAFNSLNTYYNFSDCSSKVLYLPNIYSHMDRERITRGEFWNYFLNRKKFKYRCSQINIGCFGAIRPLKNQLLQAFAAVAFGDKHNVSVSFFINATRVEQGGESTLKNIRALFANNPKHSLVEVPWLERGEFLDFVSWMDVGMQLSFNESFNIVTADFVNMRIPIIVSSAIDWMPLETQVDSELTCAIVRKLENALTYKSYFVKKSVNTLDKYNKEALKVWRDAI
jgi:hypothetical protein